MPEERDNDQSHCRKTVAGIVEALPSSAKLIALALKLLSRFFSLFGGLRWLTPRAPVIPKSLKGLSPLSESDGEVFVALERNGEVQKCINLLEALNAPVITLHGPSGSGKTSVLNAGVKFRLQRPMGEAKEPQRGDAICVYWSCVEGEPVRSMARTIETLVDIPCGTDLNKLLTIAHRPLLILVDQLERLHRSNPQHKPIFDFIAEAAKQTTPFNSKLVIAFRSDYLAEWDAFQREANIIADSVEVAPLTIMQATRVMKRILADAQIRTKSSVINRYIRDIADNRRVFPVGIALGSLAFFKWSQAGGNVRLQDYLIAGGVAAVLRDHAGERLGPVFINAADRGPLLRALLTTLIDEDEKSTKLRSASLASINEEAKLDDQTLRRYLRHLEAARILDRNSVTESYALTNPQLAPVLKELDHGIGGHINQAILGRYRLWKQEGERRYLLRRRDLRLVLADPGTLIGFPDEFERARYVRLSAGARRRKVVAAAVVLVVLCVAGTSGWHRYAKSQFRSKLQDSGLPPDLYDRQKQLNLLAIDQRTPNDQPGAGKPRLLSDLDWLNSDRLGDFMIASPGLGSLNGLSHLGELQSLDIDLNGVPIENLHRLSVLHRLRSLVLRGIGRAQTQLVPEIGTFPELRKLDLDLERSRVSVIPDLAGFHELKDLALDVRASQISQLPNLAGVPQLRSVALFLDGSKLRSFDPLGDLKHLETLTLSLDGTQVQFLSGLKDSLGPQALTLSFSSPPITDVPDLSGMNKLISLTLHMPGPRGSQIPDMTPVPDITHLKGLQELAIFLHGSEINSLPELGRLTGLRTLRLDLQASGMQKLPDISKLHNLERLTLNVSNTEIPDLPDFREFPKLYELNLSLEHSRIHSLHGIEQLGGLKALTWDIRGATVKDVGRVIRLDGLDKLSLYLGWPQVHDLPDLSLIKNLRVLELHVDGWWSTEELPDLSGLSNLEELALDVKGSHITALPNLSHLEHLRKITLNLQDSDIRDLSALEHVRNLEELSLDLNGAGIEVLPDLTSLKRLRAVAADIRHSRVKVAETQHLSAVKQLTIEGSTPSLTSLPRSVEKLSFGP